MTRRVTAEHLAALKKELGYDKNTQFINKSRGSIKKHKSKHKKYVDLVEDEKAFVKFCRKHLDPWILYRYEFWVKDEDTKRQFRRNILRLIGLPSAKEIEEKREMMEEKRKTTNKVFKKFVEEKNPEDLSEYIAMEDKFERKRTKLIRKYQKKGFIYTDNAFLRVDLKEFTSELIKRHEEKRVQNDKLLKELGKQNLKDNEDVPPHLRNIDKLFERVEKRIKSNTKKLEKGISENDLRFGTRY